MLTGKAILDNNLSKSIIKCPNCFTYSKYDNESVDTISKCIYHCNNCHEDFIVRLQDISTYEDKDMDSILSALYLKGL